MKVWDAATGKQKLTIEGHTDSVNSVVFSPDGHRIVSGSNDKTIKVWHASTGVETLTLKGKIPLFSSVEFSLDGLSIVSKSAGEIKVWDATRRMPRSD